MELVRNAFLICGPWQDKFAAEGGVRMPCHICKDGVAVSPENVQKVKDYELRVICNVCFEIGNAIGVDFELGGYLMGDVVPMENFNPTKKPC